MDSNIDYLFNKVASNKIKKFREDKNYSLEDVVKKMNYSISRQMLFKYENNLARMKNNVFVDICKALDKNPADAYKEINLEVKDTVDGIFDIDKEPIGFTMVNSENGQKEIMMKIPNEEFVNGNAKSVDSALSIAEIQDLKKRIASLGIPEFNTIKEDTNFDNAKPVDIEALAEYVEIPVLGRIPAGMPFEAIEDQYTLRKEKIPLDWLKGNNEYFALELDGDSMEPEYHDKDIVIFLKRCDCESGQDCCVRINGFDATFKRIKKQENGIMIVPLNEENSTGFHSQFYTNEEIQNKPIEILGVVKQIRRNK